MISICQLQAQCTNPPSFIINGDFSTHNGSGDFKNPDVLGWYASHGTPSVSIGTNNNKAWMWSRRLWQLGGHAYGEGIFTCYNFGNGKTYEVTMDVKTRNAGRIIVKAANGLTQNVSTSSPGGKLSNIVTTASQSIADDNTAYSTTTTVTYTFTANQNFRQLLIYPANTVNSTQFELAVDNIEVREIIPCVLNNVNIMGSIDANNPCVYQFQTNATTGTFTHITGYTWSTGDGTTYQQPTINHLYTAPGKYEVCLTVTGSSGDQNCTQTICQVITVEGCESVPCTIDADFKVDPFSSTGLSQQFHFNPGPNHQSTVTNYFWSFGDGLTSTQQNPNHTYAIPGVYNVCLYIFGNSGSEACCDEICREITVKKDTSDPSNDDGRTLQNNRR